MKSCRNTNSNSFLSRRFEDFEIPQLRTLFLLASFLLLPHVAALEPMIATARAADSPHSPQPSMTVRFTLPEDVLEKPFSFAGEVVPFQRSDVRYRVATEINFLLTDARSVLIGWLIPRQHPIQVVQPILAKQGVPAEFVFFYPVLPGLARNEQKPSPVGVWQISRPCDKTEGIEMAEDSWHDDRMDLELATQCFASRIKYLRGQIRGESWIMAAAAYVTSANIVSDAQGKWNSNSFWDVPLPSNAERLICRWIALAIIHTHQKYYQINIPSLQPVVLDKVTGLELSRDLAVAEIAAMLGIPAREVLSLNPKLKHAVGIFPALSGSKKLDHTIYVPKGKGALLVRKLQESGHLDPRSKRSH